MLDTAGRLAGGGMEASAPAGAGKKLRPHVVCGSEHIWAQYKNHRLNNGDFLLWESIIIRFVCRKDNGRIVKF